MANDNLDLESECISHFIHDGKDRDQAVAICSNNPEAHLASLAAKPPSLFTENNKRYAKFFLISDKINQNAWSVTSSSIPKFIKSFIGRPYVDEPGRAHFGAENMDTEQILKEQEKYRAGNIVDVQYDKKTGQAYAIVEITNNKTWEELKQGKDIYVSPAVSGYPVENGQGYIFSEWVGLHLARVNKPAYGQFHASLRKTCEGENDSCRKQLLLTASIANTSFEKNCSCKSSMNTDNAALVSQQQQQQNNYSVSDLLTQIESLKKENEALKSASSTAAELARTVETLTAKVAAMEKIEKEKIASEIAALKVEADIISQDQVPSTINSLLSLEKSTLETQREQLRPFVAKITELKAKTAGVSIALTNPRAVSAVKTASSSSNNNNNNHSSDNSDRHLSIEQALEMIS